MPNPLQELTSWSKSSSDGSRFLLKKGSVIYVGGNAQDYVVMEDVVISRASPGPEDTARDPYG